MATLLWILLVSQAIWKRSGKAKMLIGSGPSNISDFIYTVCQLESLAITCDTTLSWYCGLLDKRQMLESRAYH